ncbi:hypothetical protein HGRIS_010370 [Hohenbuehelia grisea]|uniref:Uncharacterized protein n=1 Tax=Hohenbuehelia grisea TaxID=104357 RepID=A0ABR3J4I7_9AGAR
MQSLLSSLLLLSSIGLSFAAPSKDDKYRNVLDTSTKDRNDWKKPCTDKCVFDIPDHIPGDGYMELSGKGIVDITEANNWWPTQLCPPHADWEAAKDKDTEYGFKCMEPGKCVDPLGPDGFVGKVARLPSDCENWGFGVVKKVTPKGLGYVAVISHVLKHASTDGEFILSGVNHPTKAQEARFRKRLLNDNGSFYPADKRWEWDPSKDFNFQKSLERTSLMNAEVDCGKAKVQSSLEIAGDAIFNIKIGIYVRGTWYGAIKEAYAFALLDGRVEATIDLSVMADGAFDTKEISMLVEGIPALTFGKFFKVGPTLEILTRADGDFKMTTDVNYKFEYLLDKTEFRFPDHRDSTFEPQPDKSPLTMTLDSAFDARGYIRGHIIPRLTVSLTIWDVEDASFFVDVDTSIRADLKAWATSKQHLIDNKTPKTSGKNSIDSRAMAVSEQKRAIASESAQGGEFNLEATFDVRAGALLQEGEALHSVLKFLGHGDAIDKIKTYDVHTKTYLMYNHKWGKDAEKRDVPMLPRADEPSTPEEFEPTSPPGEGKKLLPFKAEALKCSIEVDSEAWPKMEAAFADGKTSIKDWLKGKKVIEDTTEPKLIKESKKRR